jgi:DNA (cytosine-5)-methyltransferase 1
MQPKWIVWENVPGVLSSGKGRDFGTFLGALGEIGYGFAYRVLDAQWFGVAQRRRRVFVVGYLGDWRRAAAVLFERESVFGNPPTRGATGQGITSSPQGIAGNVSSKWAKGTGGPAGDECYNLVAEPHAIYSNESRCDNIPPAGLSPPLKIGSNSGGNPPAVAVRTAQTSANEHGVANEVAHTLDQVQGQAVAFSHSAAANSHGIAYVEEGTPPLRGGGAGNSMPAVAFTKSKRAQSTTDDESWVPGEVSPTMSCFDQGDTRATTVVAFRDPSPTVTAKMQGSSGWAPYNEDQHLVGVGPSMAVRRLTPRECERLQGFPDDYTLVEYRKKPAADGPRYRALGNSMAVPVMRWIGERIAMVDRIECP